jgi:hypothetical protein
MRLPQNAIDDLGGMPGFQDDVLGAPKKTSIFVEIEGPFYSTVLTSSDKTAPASTSFTSKNPPRQKNRDKLYATFFMPGIYN